MSYKIGNSRTSSKEEETREGEGKSIRGNGKGREEEEEGLVGEKKAKKTRSFHACQGTLRDQRKRGDTLSSSSSILPRFLCFREKNMTCFSGDVMVSQLSPPPHISLSLFSPPQPFLCCETLLPITQSFIKRGRQSFLAAMKNAVFAQKKSRQEKKSRSLSLSPFQRSAYGFDIPPPPPSFTTTTKARKCFGFREWWSLFPLAGPDAGA